MTETSYDRTGKAQTIVYSKYYDAGAWLVDGKLGLQIVLDHEKTVIPGVYSLQLATGTLGPDDIQATGIVTLYFVNLEPRDIQIRGLVVSTPSKEKSSPEARTVNARARSRTRVDLGTVPISNYATGVNLIVQCEVADSEPMMKEFVVKRRTEEELSKYFGRGGLPPYPWFEVPYYPFNPPLVAPD